MTAIIFPWAHIGSSLPCGLMQRGLLVVVYCIHKVLFISFIPAYYIYTALYIKYIQYRYIKYMQSCILNEKNPVYQIHTVLYSKYIQSCNYFCTYIQSYILHICSSALEHSWIGAIFIIIYIKSCILHIYCQSKS